VERVLAGQQLEPPVSADQAQALSLGPDHHAAGCVRGQVRGAAYPRPLRLNNSWQEQTSHR
jgi:hypothetical protein